MHVAIIHRLLWREGAIPLLARNLAIRLAAHSPEFQVTALAADPCPEELPARLAFVRVRTLPVSFFDLAGFGFALGVFLRLIGVHRRNRLHALLCHDSTAFYGVWLFSRLFGVPHALFMHACIYEPGKEGMYGRTREWVYKLNTRFYLRFADRICCVSQKLVEWATRLGAPPGRVLLMPNWVDLGRFTPAPRGDEPPRRLLYVGRFSPEKGPLFAVRAMPAILERVPGAELTLVGEGVQRGELEGLVEELGLRERVHFAGAMPQDKLPGFYGQADLLVMPSLSEGQGLVAIEALACGIPVVASRVGGIPETVREGLNGLLVPPGDPAALAEAVVRALTDRELYRSLAAAAPGSVARLSWDEGVRQYLELLGAMCRRD